MSANVEFSHHEFSRRVQEKVKDELTDFEFEVGCPVPQVKQCLTTTHSGLGNRHSSQRQSKYFSASISRCSSA